MKKPVDLTGLRFGRLVAIRDVGSAPKQGRVWLFRCDCGQSLSVPYLQVRGPRGRRSCGCLNPRKVGWTNQAKGESGTRLYRIWKRMHARCDPRTAGKDLERYALSGIRVCEEWGDYLPFRVWAMESGYADDLSIDRIDPTVGYAPSNCRWATVAQQSVNKRTTIMVKWLGETMPLIEACRLQGLNYWTVRSRIKSGKSPQEALGGGNEGPPI